MTEPLFTNAHINRERARQCLRAGMSPEDVANEFPEVWECVNGKLRQIYSYTLPDGRKETDYTILISAAYDAIARHKQKGVDHVSDN
jgi:hypothetical protein